MKTNLMKIPAVMALGMLALSGCGHQDSPQEHSTSGSKASKSATPTETSIPSPSFSKPSSSDIQAMFKDVSLDSSSNAKKWLNGFAKAHKSENDDNGLTFGASDSADQTGKLAEKSINYNGYEGVAQVYVPAGAYNFLKNQDKKMSNDGVEHTLDGNVLKTKDSITVYFGDALINLHVSGDNDQQKTTKALTERGKGDIESSKCKSLNVSDFDIKRNQWLSGTDYTGATDFITVNASDSAKYFPNLKIPTLVEIKDKDIERPETPLPSYFIETPPEKIQKPDFKLHAKDDSPETEKKIDVQIPDTTGPGCGWDWAKFNNHEPSMGELESRKEQMVEYQKKVLDKNLEKYTKDHQDDSMKSLDYAADANKWNIYANKVNKAHDQWKQMTEARKKFKPKWDAYVKARNYWYEFDDLKDAARDQYQADVQDCKERDSDAKDWDVENPGQKDSANRPGTCSKEPDEPKILDEEKPDEPKKIDIPDDVTIPDSWEKPKG